MKTFEYTGLNKKGVKVTEIVQAENDKIGRSLVKKKIHKITQTVIVPDVAQEA